MIDVIDRYIDKMMTSIPEMPLWNIQAIKMGKKPSWNYIDGCMINSLLEMYEITGKKKYLRFVIDYVDYYVLDSGEIRGYKSTTYSMDDVCESKVLFDLYKYTNDQKYLRAIELSYTQIINQPRTKEGCFVYKAIYPNQVWINGLYMMLPFYTRYQSYCRDNDYRDIVNQFAIVRKIMFDEKAKLYYHGYDSSKSIFWADKETGLSKSFWLRAMAWFMIGLVDTYTYMDESRNKDRDYMAKLFKEAIDGVLLYQDPESKMFYQVVDQGNREGNYLESSGSSMIAYAILRGVRLGLLDESYLSRGKEIFEGICKHSMTVSDIGELNLSGICLIAGLGPENNPRRDGSFEYYISEPVVDNEAKGVAPFIMAYTEMCRLEK